MLITGEESEQVALHYLEESGEAILRKMYPFESEIKAEVPYWYHTLQIEIAVYLLNKRGNEGTVQHTEQAVTDVYETGYIPDSMLKSVVPYAKVVS